ncbi:MAG: serine O-acetyltransferase EpsC [Bradymonadia bacterium]|jgi:serine O-acetyltransferase
MTDARSQTGLDAIVDALLESYDRDRGDTPLCNPLPSREAIADFVERTRRILFPGFYVDVELPAAGRRYHVGTWLCELHGALARLLRLAFAHESPQVSADETRTRAREVSFRFLQAIPALRDHLLDDARAALDGDPAARSLEEIILTYPGFQAITAHRVAHTLHLEGVPFVPRAIAEHSHERTGIDLHPGAVVGRRFFIDHGTGVVIGETSNIGDNVKIYQGVTLGALSVHRRLAGTKRHPTLEDDVVVYAGATVLGGETVIGRGAVVGGNAFITTSVAPGARVVGVSAGEERR